MRDEGERFQTLFRKYRLKSEFATLSELGHALSEKGLTYEESVFSHWQNGTRIPQSRNILLKLIEIFVERNALTTVKDANDLLLSARQGLLSQEELTALPFRLHNPVFQVPHEITHFTGRQNITDRVTHKTDITGNVILIHGIAGVGKTALAIRLGHLLRDRYPDGVLWFKVEEDNAYDILLSIARIFGQDVTGITNTHVMAAVVRSLLVDKHILLFLDSGELCEDIDLLIPTGKTCTTIITSQNEYLKTPTQYIPVKLDPFTNEESLSLFHTVLKEKFPLVNTKTILSLSKRVGNLPLALHILAKQLQYSGTRGRELLTDINKEDSFILDLYKKEKNLYSAIAASYETLDDSLKTTLISASVFKGKDFSAQSIGFINGLSAPSIIVMLHKLVDLSLLEHSTKKRYRLHPAIREFVRDKLDHPRSSRLMFIAVGLFLFFSLWWGLMESFMEHTDARYLAFTASYVVIPIYGGICGIHTAQKWGGIKTIMGRSVYMLSLGLLMQAFGQTVYAYYTNFQHIMVPYPSLGDIGYFGTIPLYTYGALLLAKSSGIKISIQSFRKKTIALVIPLTMVLVAYAIFLHDYIFDFSSPMKIFLDYGYPLGDALYVSIAIIIFIFSRTILNGIMKSKAFLLLVALIVQFLADYVFLYTSAWDSYYPGHYTDFIYLASYFTMTIALLHLKSIFVRIKS